MRCGWRRNLEEKLIRERAASLSEVAARLALVGARYRLFLGDEPPGTEERLVSSALADLNRLAGYDSQAW